jgi:hypothetical protein
MTGLMTEMQSKLNKVSEFVLHIVHRSMGVDGGLREVPVRASVTEWCIPEDEAGPQMTYLEIASAYTEITGEPFDPDLITDGEIHEAIVSKENALEDDSEQLPFQESQL